MFRRLSFSLAVLGALAVAPSALAAYPPPYAAQGNPGVLNNDGSLRYVAFDAGGDATVISAIKTSDGSRLQSANVAGSFGIPMLTNYGLAGGVFRDGSAFVLQSTKVASPTRFMILNTNDLSARDSITLKGVFGFDALSPDGSKLYLIQHRTANDLQHYIVRAYDLSTRTLLPGRIADKTQKSWVMQGWAVTRATSSNGRWVYTLYANPGGFPFIHALDTVKGVAHCVGIPWPATDPDQTKVYSLVMSVHGTRLAVDWKSGGKFLSVNRSNWRVSKAKP